MSNPRYAVEIEIGEDPTDLVKPTLPTRLELLQRLAAGLGMRIDHIRLVAGDRDEWSAWAGEAADR